MRALGETAGKSTSINSSLPSTHLDEVASQKEGPPKPTADGAVGAMVHMVAARMEENDTPYHIS